MRRRWELPVDKARERIALELLDRVDRPTMAAERPTRPTVAAATRAPAAAAAAAPRYWGRRGGLAEDALAQPALELFVRLGQARERLGSRSDAGAKDLIGGFELALRLENRRPRQPEERVRRADATRVQVVEDWLGVAHEVGEGDPHAEVARVVGKARIVSERVRAPLEHRQQLLHLVALGNALVLPPANVVDKWLERVVGGGSGAELGLPLGMDCRVV